MRRLRNVAIATFILIGITFLFAQHHDKLPEAYRFRRPFGNSGKNGNNSTVSEPTPTTSNEETPSLNIETPTSSDHAALLTRPSQSALDSSNNHPHQDSTPQETQVPENSPPSSSSSAPGNAPEVPPSGDLQLPAESNSDPPAFEAEFLFQQDLKLDLPIETLKKFTNNKPHNYEPNGPKTNVYATFMATRNPSLKDPYYMAIHSLIYRVLWSPRSRTEKYPMVVFVGEFVTPQQRQLLSGAGAIVRELSPLEWNPNVPGIQHRWKDLFAKLNMWNETEFSRIFFLDADAFPVANVDNMFDMSPTQNCIDSNLQPDDYLLDGSKVCEPYVFAGVPQDPFNTTDVNINVGSMVFSPSERMHQRLLQNYVKTDRYNCLMAEQAFLNWQFNINGAYPATIIDREYGGFFPQEEDEGKLKIVHEKLWSEERRWLKQEWLTQWQEMLTFYAGPQFSEARKKDGSEVLQNTLSIETL